MHQRKCAPGGVWGSDPTAASGGGREGSEWQRSARNEPASPGEVFAGYRNRSVALIAGAINESHLPRRILWVLSWRNKKVPPPAGNRTTI